MERATRLARGTAVPRHAQRATNAPPGRFLASLAPCSTLCPLEPKNRRFCAVQAFCAAKPWRRANSLRPSILISCRNPKKEVTTYVVTSFFGAGDEARSRHCRAATRTAGDKRPTGAFSRFARALFDPLPAGAKKSALLRRTSVLRSKTLAEGEFTSPEHLNFLPESKKRSHNIRCDFFFWSGRRGSNSLPPPWQGGALPDELRPRNKMYYTRHFPLCQA